MTNREVDDYITRSEKWPEEMTALRPTPLGSGLTEEIKWGKPCYSHGGGNIVILQEMREFLALMFFKGALLHDPEGVLETQGPNSRSARRMRFTSVEDVARLTTTVKAYIAEAIDVEEAGLEVDAAPELVLVAELQNRLDRDTVLTAAFESLTPGRQRDYNLYFSGAKQAKTREARVEKYAQKILDGKGLRDRRRGDDMPGGHDYPGPPEALAQYQAAIETASSEAVVKGAKNPYTSRNGHMFSFLTPDGTMALRLSEELGEQFQAEYESGPVMQYGSVMRGYVSIPAELLANPAELAPWFDQAWDWIGSLPPKPTKKT